MQTPSVMRCSGIALTGYLGPITRADLAALTVGCLGDAQCCGKTCHLRDESLR